MTVTRADLTDSDLAYFVRHVTENGDCREWTGPRNPRGYGQFSRSHGPVKISTSAQRVAWMFYRGDIPAGYVIDHLCRNHACVNIAHLEPVTPSENARRGVRDNPHWGPRPGARWGRSADKDGWGSG